MNQPLLVQIGTPIILISQCCQQIELPQTNILIVQYPRINLYAKIFVNLTNTLKELCHDK
jgi:hypothetical protein